MESGDGEARGKPAPQIAGVHRISAGDDPTAPLHVADPVAANQARTYTNVATAAAGVRRLTPRECERLQGLPDDFTAITYRGKPAADGPRYRAIGNSMAVPVVRWILSRLAAVDA